MTSDSETNIDRVSDGQQTGRHVSPRGRLGFVIVAIFACTASNCPFGGGDDDDRVAANPPASPSPPQSPPPSAPAETCWDAGIDIDPMVGCHRVSFDVRAGDPEIYEAELTYPNFFEFNGFDVVGPPGEYQVRLVVEGGVQIDLTDEETRFVTVASPTSPYDLGVRVSGLGTVRAGEEAIFGVTVDENPSTANPGVVVEAPLPAGFTFVRTEPPPPDFRGTYEPSTGVWTFTMPEPGLIASMQIVARADTAGDHTFGAEIVAGLGAGDAPQNNSAEIDFAVLPAAGVTACLSSLTQVSSGPFVWQVEADASCRTGPIAEYRWWQDFNFAGQLPTAITTTPVSPRFDYEESGTYDIRLEVSDGAGGSDAVQVPFVVQ